MAGAGRGSVNPPAASSTPDMSAYVPRRTPGPLTDVDRPGTRVRYENEDVSDITYKKGGKTKKMAKGGMTKMKAGGGVKSKMAPTGGKMGKVATGKPSMGSASKRADGVAKQGLTKGRMLKKGGRVI